METNTPDNTFLGQSGDLVEIIQGSEHTVVRKTAKSDSKKLKLQYEKQLTYKNSFLSTPRITQQWDSDKFEMEYVPGIALGNYLSFASHIELKNCVSKISNGLASNLRDSFREKESLSESQEFKNKLRDLEKSNFDISRIQVRKGLKTLELYSRQMKILSGANHGDYSFENILVNTNTGKIWLIDFLPSPIESPLVDVGRILIDAEHGWWKSGIQQTATQILAGQFLAEHVRDLLVQHEIPEREISFFKIFAVLRILPYTYAPIRKSLLLAALDFELTKHWKV